MVHFTVIQCHYGVIASIFQSMFLMIRSAYQTNSLVDGIGLLNGIYSGPEWVMLVLVSLITIAYIMLSTVANQL